MTVEPKKLPNEDEGLIALLRNGHCDSIMQNRAAWLLESRNARIKELEAENEELKKDCKNLNDCIGRRLEL